MSDLTFQDILKILRLIDSAEFAELQVEFEGIKLKVSRKAGIAPAGNSHAIGRTRALGGPAESATAPVAQNQDITKQVDDTHTPGLDLTVSPSTPEIANRIDIKSAMAGTFYSAPSPGAAPFVKVGQIVIKGDKLGIVEVMKLFTAVVSPCDGTVLEILVENEEFVENEQTLMIIDATQ